MKDWRAARKHFEDCTEMDICRICDDFWNHRNNCVVFSCPCHLPSTEDGKGRAA